MEPCIFNAFSSITNKMQGYKIFFITINALQVSGVFSAHHQELKTVRTSSSICQACLLLLLESFRLTHTSGSSKQAWYIHDAVCKVFELLMMGGETAWNMYSIDSNKEYCVTLHLVGYTWKKNAVRRWPKRRYAAHNCISACPTSLACLFAIASVTCSDHTASVSEENMSEEFWWTFTDRDRRKLKELRERNRMVPTWIISTFHLCLGLPSGIFPSCSLTKPFKGF
jgi:hypothetical protein